MNISNNTITIKAIISVLKNDGRFQGNQKTLSVIITAISAVKFDSNIIAYANAIKTLITQTN